MSCASDTVEENCEMVVTMSVIAAVSLASAWL
jgi:hypothetical protein